MEPYRVAAVAVYVLIWIWIFRALVVIFDHGSLYDQLLGVTILTFWTGLTIFAINDRED